MAGFTHPVEVRSEVFLLLLAGHSTEDVARMRGIHAQTIRHWAKVAGMELRQGGRGGAVAAPLAEEQLVEHGRLTLASRVIIQIRVGDGWSMRAIAKVLQMAPSTVSRGLARGRCRDGRYEAAVAHARAARNRRRPRPIKLAPGSALRTEVVARLRRHHSPMQIACRLRRDFPDRQDMCVSHETIYQALYVQGKNNLRAELARDKVLRTGRKHRCSRSALGVRSTRAWLEGARLSDRPAEVADRAVPGHWEGDLVIGKDGHSAIITLAERSTRFVLLGEISSRHSMTVVEALQAMVADLPAHLRRTLTWDQGSEMSEHARFTTATSCPVFFCDPHSPWQRGTNENTNGLVREFFPKGTDFDTVTAAELRQAQDLLNTRPRQTLDWATPAEKLDTFIRVAQ